MEHDVENVRVKISELNKATYPMRWRLLENDEDDAGRIAFGSKFRKLAFVIVHRPNDAKWSADLYDDERGRFLPLGYHLTAIQAAKRCYEERQTF
jgi:hypothetical protein